MDFADLRTIRKELNNSTVENYRNFGDATPHATIRDNVLTVLGGRPSGTMGELAAQADALSEEQLAVLPPYVLLFFLVDSDARATAFALPEGDLSDDDRAVLDAACVFGDPGDVGDDPDVWGRLMKLVVAVDTGPDADEADALCEDIVDQWGDFFEESALSFDELRSWAGRWQRYRITSGADLNRRFVRVTVANQAA